MRIICFTGSRAEYYLLRPLFLNLERNKNFEIFLIVSGGILSESSLQTISDIEKDKLYICGKINLEKEKENHSKAIGKLSIQIVDIVKTINPDLAIVYADRYESFGFAIASAHSNIPLLHIEAGDITEGGTFDDQIRHCISKLSHLFCTSTLKGCETLHRLGEEKWRCIQSGLLSYEDMKKISQKDKISVISEFDITDDIPILLATMHPIPRDLKLTELETLEFLEGLKIFSNQKKSKIIFTAPNNDFGNEIIHKLIENYLNQIKNFVFIESLGGKRYHTLMSLAEEKKVIICGNSSSVIKEAPYYGAHSLNVGIRQSGREESSSQVNCLADRYLISAKLNELCNKKCEIGFNPYLSEKNPSQTIINFIEEIFRKKTHDEIMFKKWSN